MTFTNVEGAGAKLPVVTDVAVLEQRCLAQEAVSVILGRLHAAIHTIIDLLTLCQCSHKTVSIMSTDSELRFKRV